MTARLALPPDADELVRLRAVMLRSFEKSGWNDDWREPARRTLVDELGRAGSTLGAFVVDRPGGDGLAACALGNIDRRLGNPYNQSGLVGYIYNVVTDPDMRKRGYSRSCMTALIEWFRERGVSAVDLRASADGEPLYESLGFRRSAEPGMRLRLS